MPVSRAVWLTGSTSGLGARLADELALRGWRLLLPVRDPAVVSDLVARLERLGAAEVVPIACDLAHPDALDGACDQALTLGPLDLVLDVAGLGAGTDATRRETAPDGLELRMAVNARAPHVIALRLGPGLAPGGRIVQVGSAGQGEIPLDDLGFERDYDGVHAYLRSKTALVMSTVELAARGLPVTVVHPAREMPTRMVLEAGFPVASTLDDGVLPVLRAALDSSLDGVTGVYLDRFDVADPHPQVADADARRAVVAHLEGRPRR